MWRGSPDAGAGTPRQRILAVYDLLGEWFTTPGFRGCPFIDSEPERGPDVAAHRVNLEHRRWVGEVFGGLLAEEGVRDADRVASRLTLLYDGAMSSAQVEPDVDWADAAQHAATAVVEGELRRG